MARTDFADTKPINCGNCERSVAATILYSAGHTVWLRCPACTKGSVINGTVASPPAPAGQHVNNLPEDVANAWREARTTHAVAAYTASEMMCRKILMHIAVDAASSAADKTFAEYIDDLVTGGHVTTRLRPAADRIRSRGGAATHELPASTEVDSLTTLKITEHLLRDMYELPALL